MGYMSYNYKHGRSYTGTTDERKNGGQINSEIPTDKPRDSIEFERTFFLRSTGKKSAFKKLQFFCKPQNRRD